MRLINLEIKGFKSFADKTVVNFNEGITGIVGPNGCGKSNIVDAIRWVLGEQKSSSLRSEKMENLIFNGTKKRRASGLAEVSLTFENTKNLLPTEYSTITISRHYYRSGDSEYRLNGVPCRLKDITGLFMDTGISSDSYAIIELGMVDALLTDKENSRRKLFEQAAGVEKYKTRKRESISKLSSTEADLDRVEDLLFEIENNLKTLESQARRAKRYYKLKEEYRESSIQLAILLLSDQKEAFKSINKKIEQEKDKRSQIEAELRKIEALHEREKAEIISKEQALSGIQRQLNEKVSQLQRLENERNILQEKIKHSQERMAYLQRQIAQREQQLDLFSGSIGDLRQKLQSEESNLQDHEQQLGGLKNQLNEATEIHRQKQQALNEHRQNLQQTERQVYDVEKQLAVLSSQYDNLIQELQSTSRNSEDQTLTMKNLREEVRELEGKKKTAEQELEKLQKKEENHQSDITSTEQLIEKIKQELQGENRQLDARRNEYQLTKNLVDNLEGYPESIKFLRKEVKQTKNAPLLADIISCDDAYRAAIENFLEPFLNYYVVNTLEEAVDAIRILGDASKGRASFFVLEDFAGYQGSGSFRMDNSVAAVEIMDVEPKYQRLAAFLLDNVFIIDEVNGQNHDVLKLLDDDRVNLITKSGKIIRQSHSISGGAVGLFEGKKLGRIKNLEKLEKAIKKLEEKTLQINQKLNDLLRKHQQLKKGGYRQEIEQARENINRISQQIITRNSRAEHLEQQLTSASDKEQNYKQRLDDLKQRQENQRQDLEQKQETLHKYRSSGDDLENGFEKAAATRSRLSEEYNQKNILFHQQQNRLNSLQQELKYKEQQITDAEQQITSHNREIKDIEERLRQFEQRFSQMADELQQNYQRKEELEQQVVRAEEIYFGSRGKINELDDQLRNLNRQKNQLDIILSELREKLNDLKLSLAGMRERMSVEFNVDINDLINREPDESVPVDELQELVQKIKHRLDTYGEINPMAVEAFNEMKERYDFIIGQKNDLLEAKKDLLETIEEIDKTAKAQFMTSFEEVREHFHKVFRTLFMQEDTCDIYLTDPDNPLESKIEIIARPKGKRPLTINQLSGGEKTLTATALLFSLYLIKPAPFCIFDEVDAPLDDQNIDKFTRIIKEFSKDSQFIIVTHNKQTMSTVDIIYGVTMVEEGISKVVPVDFSSLN